MKLEFCSLSSGSSGNCYYLGNGFHGILIDAGISAGSIRKYLKTMGIPMSSIMGILISHNHFDHIKGLEVLTKRNHIPVFTSDNVWKSILDLPYEKNITTDCIRKVSVHQRFHLAGFDVEAFPIHHDAPETLGFHICAGKHQITIITDLGHICDTAAKYIKAANFLVIESNYDEQMLVNGGYPYYLKQRILSNNGHLGNHQTSSFLAENIHENISHICLAHLSRNNNTPEKALETLHKTFSEKGRILNGKPRIITLHKDLLQEIITLED